MSILLVVLLAFIQNISFTMVSRSRNRDNMTYHAVCSVLSNALWFLTMRELVTADLSLKLIAPYIAGTVTGSICGAKISMWIERKVGATT